MSDWINSWGTCPTCKERGFLSGHKCAPAYLCRPEDYEPEDAVQVYADNPESAAEKYLEDRFSDFDYPNSMTVIVNDPRTNKAYTVFVEVEAVPSFSGSIRSEDGEEETEESTEGDSD